eukprot:2914381-Pyramimonas_sp.AAC.2
MAGPLYRAANVMGLGSYWLGMCRGLEKHLRSNLVVVHHELPDPQCVAAARKILQLTWGRGACQGGGGGGMHNNSYQVTGGVRRVRGVMDLDVLGSLGAPLRSQGISLKAS